MDVGDPGFEETPTSLANSNSLATSPNPSVCNVVLLILFPHTLFVLVSFSFFVVSLLVLCGM